jgi:hypothetical protein
VLNALPYILLVYSFFLQKFAIAKLQNNFVFNVDNLQLFKKTF